MSPDIKSVEGLRAASTQNMELENIYGTLNFSLAVHRFISFYSLSLGGQVMHKLAELGLFCVDGRYLRCNFCKFSVAEEEFGQLITQGTEESAALQIEERHSQFMCQIHASKNVPMGGKTELNLGYEAHRLYSLLRKVDWQHVDPFGLAKSGFYYTGDEDNVRCAFCNLEVRGWGQGDTPDGEHRRWNDRCPLVCNSPGVTDVPIGHEQLDVRHDGVPEFSSSANPGNDNPLSRFGPHVEPSANFQGSLNIHNWCRPLNPGFSTLGSRIDSFGGAWAQGRRQTPLAMATAGFYLSANAGRAVCFHCNLAYDDRDPDPLVQHCKWRPVPAHEQRCRVRRAVFGDERKRRANESDLRAEAARRRRLAMLFLRTRSSVPR